MLLHQILDAIDNRIDNTVYWTDAIKTSIVNDCLRSIVSHFEIRFKGYAKLYAVDGQQRYNLPIDYISSDLLYTNTDSLDREIHLLDSPDQLYTKFSNVSTYESSPTNGFLWPLDGRDMLWLYPVPDKQYTLEWWYFRELPTLVNDDDEPVIDRNFHNFIVDYGEWFIKKSDGDMSELEFQALWEKTLKKMSVAKTKQISDSIDFKPGTALKNLPHDTASEDIFILADPTGSIIWGKS